MSKSKKELIFNLSLAAVVFGLYLLNKSKGLFYFLPFRFGQNHFNDVLAGMLFPAYLNLIMRLAKSEKRFTKPLELALVALSCGFVWECCAPLFKPSATSDLADIACYVIGTMTYWICHQKASAMYNF